MRVNTSFFLKLDTFKTLLDTLNIAIITNYVKVYKAAEQGKIILTGLNDYTKRGILFEVTYFVKVNNEIVYSIYVITLRNIILK